MADHGPWPHGGPMPLSTNERQRLAEIEAGLSSDREFLAAVQDLGGDGRPRRHIKRTVAAAMMLIGIAVTVSGGVLAPRSFVVGLVIGLAGFVVVVAGAVVWFTARERTY